MRTKIGVIGAGHVGSHVARSLAAGKVADEIVLVDILPEKAAAQAMDIADSQSFPPEAVIVRSGPLKDCRDADIIINAIGKAREKGQTRLDLLGDSVRMARGLAEELKQEIFTPAGGEEGLRAKGPVVVSITNPCDIIAGYLQQALSLPRFQAFGTGTLLDTARLIRVLSEQTGVARSSISAWVMGEHGDSSMIPYSAIRIGGLPAEAYPGFNPAEALERTHGIGMDIIEGKGSTEFGIGQAAAYLCQVILSDARAVLPVSVRLEGEYGLSGISCGVPCVIGRNGIEAVAELTLTDSEKEALYASAAVLERYTRLASEV